MDKFLSPQSIAIIGASRDTKKLGSAIVKNLIDFAFPGRLYPINPKTRKIFHLKCYPSVLKVDDEIDLAVIVVPANIVPLVLEECGQKGIKNIVIISAGFREQGQNGQKREQEINRLKTKYRFQILGPNCLGFINTVKNINATFAANTPKKGNVAFMSQSGALATSVLDLAEEVNLGFSYFVSLGNKLDLHEVDFLETWAKDDKLKAIFMYLEDIRYGKLFMQKAKEIAFKKPVIILKPGESKEAREAISSHTGSIAGDYRALETGLKQSGIIQTNSVEDFFHLMILFNNFPVSFGERVAIITNAGGPAVIATEELIKNKLKLAKFTKITQKNLRENLPATINIRDPLDVVGDALADRYENAIKNLLDDENVDVIMVLLTPQFMTEIERTARIIVKYAKEKKKLIVTSFIGGTNVSQGITLLQRNKVAHFRYPNQAVTALAKIVEHQKWKNSHNKNPKITLYTAVSSHHKIRAKELIDNKKDEYLTDSEAFNICKLYDIPVANHLVANTFEQVRVALEILKPPLVMKVSSPKLVHKTESNLIVTNINDPKEVLNYYEKLLKKAERVISKDHLAGILLQEMVSKDFEAIVGVTKDQNFGHLLMFGSGGIYTEIYKDVAFRLIPTDRISINEMVEETKAFEILTGARGKKFDINAVKNILIQIQQLIQDFPQIKEIDINPLIINEQEIKAVDVKIKIE